MERKRIVFLDYLRVVACFLVILVHSIEPFYLDGVGLCVANRTNALLTTLLGSPIRIAVPLFVITSSYLLFPVCTSTRLFFEKRFKRVVVPLLVWSVFYLFTPLIMGDENYSLSDGVKRICLNFTNQSAHLWFVYMLLGVYIAMPLLSPWVNNATRKEERIFLFAWLWTTTVPFLHALSSHIFGLKEILGEAYWNEFGTLYYISGYIGYVVLGDYIRKYIDWDMKKTLRICIPLFLVGYMISAGWFWCAMPKAFPVKDDISMVAYIENSWRFCSFGVVLCSFATFMMFRLIKKEGCMYKGVLKLSKLSYGVYLVHLFVLGAMYKIISALDLSMLPVILLTAVSTFIVSSCIIWLLSWLPKTKYIIG
ncbi:MAG: acyltransferase family protein [Alistipes sp.]|nr:acyltransferase family protein [Candidatus Alistipes equi]